MHQERESERQTTAFIPPTIGPADKPHNFFSVMTTTVNNPLTFWTRYFFEETSFAVTMGPRRFIHLMSPKLAKQVLLEEESCFKRSFMVERLLKPALGDSLITTDGATWQQQRRAAAPAFRHDALQALVPVMARAGEETVVRIDAALDKDGNGHLDVHQEMMRATYDVIAWSLLSANEMPESYTQQDLLSDVEEFLVSVGQFNILDMLAAPNWIPRWLVNPRVIKGRAAANRLRRFARDQIKARKEANSDEGDLLHLLINAHDPKTGGKLSDLQLVDNLVTFIGAGHETTAVTLTWAISILSRMPELADELAAEAEAVLDKDGGITPENLTKLDLHERVIMETLRLYPAAPAVARSVVKPVTIDGHDLKEGDHVVVAIYPLQRHEKVWERPTEFDPDRFLPERRKKQDRYAWMPFGAGPKICIGMKLSMMEATAILALLTRNFKFKADETHEIVPKMTVTLRPEGGMPVYIERR